MPKPSNSPVHRTLQGVFIIYLFSLSKNADYRVCFHEIYGAHIWMIIAAAAQLQLAHFVAIFRGNNKVHYHIICIQMSILFFHSIYSDILHSDH